MMEQKSIDFIGMEPFEIERDREVRSEIDRVCSAISSCGCGCLVVVLGVVVSILTFVLV